MAEKWRIVATEERPLWDHGQFLDVIEVRWKTNQPPLITGTVNVPKELASPQAVADAVNAAVETQLAIHDL